MTDNPIAAAIARAQQRAAAGRVQAEDDLARIRRENPDFALLADELRELCGGRVSYLHEFATGKTWGMTVEELARRDKGVGVSVPAFWPASWQTMAEYLKKRRAKGK